jgi:hypothetical protein
MDEDDLDRLRLIAADPALTQQGPRVRQGGERTGERGASLVRRQVVDVKGEYLSHAS